MKPTDGMYSNSAGFEEVQGVQNETLSEQDRADVFCGLRSISL